MGKEAGGMLCGWCMTGHHDGCRKEIQYFDKLWICRCSCNVKSEESEDSEDSEESKESGSTK
jgi:hypothetical protein